MSVGSSLRRWSAAVVSLALLLASFAGPLAACEGFGICCCDEGEHEGERCPMRSHRAQVESRTRTTTEPTADEAEPTAASEPAAVPDCHGTAAAAPPSPAPEIAPPSVAEAAGDRPAVLSVEGCCIETPSDASRAALDGTATPLPPAILESPSVVPPPAVHDLTAAASPVRHRVPSPPEPPPPRPAPGG